VSKIVLEKSQKERMEYKRLQQIETTNRLDDQALKGDQTSYQRFQKAGPVGFETRHPPQPFCIRDLLIIWNN
jgi:hypothetical protein